MITDGQPDLLPQSLILVDTCFRPVGQPEIKKPAVTWVVYDIQKSAGPVVFLTHSGTYSIDTRQKKCTVLTLSDG